MFSQFIDKRHTCEMLCHEGDCGACPKQTVIKCRCGSLEKTIPCAEINASKIEFKCQKKCAKVSTEKKRV